MFPVEDIPRVVLKKLVSQDEYLPEDQFVFESTQIRKKIYENCEDLDWQYNIAKADT